MFFLLLRLVLVSVAGQYTIHDDARDYNRYAHAIIEKSDWLINPDFTGNWRSPLYPLFIALVYSVFGPDQIWAVYVFQSIIGGLTCLLIFKFSRRLFDERIAFIAFIWSGFYFFYLKYTQKLMRETLVIFFFLGVFYFLYRYFTDEKSRKLYFWWGVLFYVFLIHLDAKYLFYLPFFPLLFICCLRLKKGIRHYLGFLLAILVLMVPWTVRNYLAYKGLVIISTEVFDLRKVDQREEISANRMAFKVFNFGKTTWTKFESYPDESERLLVKQGFNPENRSEKELDAIRHDVYPATTFMGRKLYNFLELWKPVGFFSSYRPFPDTRFNPKWTLKHNLSTLSFYGILLPFMVWSLVDMARHGDRRFLILFFPLLVQTLLHVLAWGIDRYRIPVDAFVIMLGIYGMVHLIEFLKPIWVKK